MYIVVAGCGRVGARLASILATDGHDVVIIDRDAEAFRSLGSTFNGLTMPGNAIDEDVLRAAGIEQADGFAAATSRDSANIMAAQIAKSIFHVPRVAARVTEPKREPSFLEFGLDTVCGTRLTADAMRALLLTEGIHHRALLGSGEVALVDVTVAPGQEGKTLPDLEVAPRFRLAAVSRRGRAFVPDSRYVTQDGDVLSYAVSVDAVGALGGLFRSTKGGR